MSHLNVTKTKKLTTVISREAAKQQMWQYYKDRKHLFIESIRLFREDIITQLQAGIEVEIVFAECGLEKSLAA